MTISVENRDPASGASNISPTTKILFSVISDQGPITTLSAWVQGQKVIDALQPVSPSQITSDGLGGFDVIADVDRPLSEGSPVTVRVTAEDGGLSTVIDTSWTFTIADVSVPVLADASPPAWSIAQTSPATLTMRIADRLNTPLTNVTDFSESNVDLTVGVNQLQLPSGSTESLLGRQGQLFEVTSGPSTGERRLIESVQGPLLATYDGAALSGSSSDITVYRQRGLDIHVDDERIVHSGYLEAAGWAAVITPSGQDIDVTLTPPAPWSLGTRVGIGIRVSDDVGNFSDINYFFDIGDTRGPQVVNIDPPNGSRGLDRTATPNSDLSFDIICTRGVNTANLNVEVNGTAAITAGTGVGNYSTSTVTPISDGYRIVLKSSVAYTDGEMVFVDISSRDNDGRDGERRILRFHFGEVVATQSITYGLTGTIIRVLAYDLSDTSFCNPLEQEHTGYAWDGYWYESGTRTNDVASWFTELGQFPVSGHFIVTDSGGWALVRSLDTSAWAICTPLVSGWSMAGRGTLTDADFGPEAPILAVACESLVVAVDWVHDHALIFDDNGRAESRYTIDNRQLDQSGESVDDDYALPTGNIQYLSLAANAKDKVLVLAQSQSLTVVHELTDQDFINHLLTRESLTALPPVVVTRQFANATWQRIKMTPLSHTTMASAFNDSGQGHVEIWDWLRFAMGEASVLLLDDLSTPALSAAEIRDIDLLPTVVVTAMVGGVDVVDYEALTSDSYNETTLGLSGVSGAEMSAVAIDRNFDVEVGNLYAAVAAASDGRVVRYDVKADDSSVLSNGLRITTLSTIGNASHVSEKYVRTSMEIV